jgi:hypothetical protein
MVMPKESSLISIRQTSISKSTQSSIEIIDTIFDDERKLKEHHLTPDDIKLARNESTHLTKLKGYFDHLNSLDYPPNLVTGKALPIHSRTSTN